MKVIQLGAGYVPDVTMQDGLVYVAWTVDNGTHLSTFAQDGALRSTQFLQDASYPRFGSGWLAYKQAPTNHPAALHLTTGEVRAFPGTVGGDPGVIIAGTDIVWQTPTGAGDARRYAVLAAPLVGGPTWSLGFAGAPDGLESVENGRVICRKDIATIAPEVGGYVQRAGDVRVGQYGFGIGVRLTDWSRTRWLLNGTITKDPRVATDGTAYAIVCWGTEVRMVLASKADLLALPLVPAEPPPVVDPPIVIPPPQEPVPMTGITDAQFSTLERLRAKYPATVTPEQIGALLNEWAWLHRSEGCGMQAKPGGTAAVQPRTGVHIWNGVRLTVAGQHFGQDVLEGATVGRAGPVRGTVGPADPASFVAPVEPEGVVVSPPAPPVPPTQPPQPPAPPAEPGIWTVVNRLLADMENMEREIAELKRRPAGTLPKLRVRGRTGSTGGFLSHSHPVELEVVPE